MTTPADYAAQAARDAASLAPTVRNCLLYWNDEIDRIDPVNIKPRQPRHPNPESILNRIPTLLCYETINAFGQPHNLPYGLAEDCLTLEFHQASCVILPGYSFAERSANTVQFPYGKLPPYTEAMIAELLRQPNPPDLIGLHDPTHNMPYLYAALPNARYRIIRVTTADINDLRPIEVPSGLRLDSTEWRPRPWAAELAAARANQMVADLETRRARELRYLQNAEQRAAAATRKNSRRPPQVHQEELAQRQTELRKFDQALSWAHQEIDYWQSRPHWPEQPELAAAAVRDRFRPEQLLRVHSAQIQEHSIRRRLSQMISPDHEGDFNNIDHHLDRLSRLSRETERLVFWNQEYRRLCQTAREVNPQWREYSVPEPPAPEPPPAGRRPAKRPEITPDLETCFPRLSRLLAEHLELIDRKTDPAQLAHALAEILLPDLQLKKDRLADTLAAHRRDRQTAQRRGQDEEAADHQESIAELRAVEKRLQQFDSCFRQELAESKTRAEAERSRIPPDWPPPPPLPHDAPKGTDVTCWLNSGLIFERQSSRPRDAIIARVAGCQQEFGRVVFQQDRWQARLTESSHHETCWSQEAAKDWLCDQLAWSRKRIAAAALTLPDNLPGPPLQTWDYDPTIPDAELPEYAARVIRELGLTLFTKHPPVMLYRTATYAVAWWFRRRVSPNDTEPGEAGDVHWTAVSTDPKQRQSTAARTFLEALHYALIQELQTAAAKPKPRTPPPEASAQTTADDSSNGDATPREPRLQYSLLPSQEPNPATSPTPNPTGRPIPAGRRQRNSL